MIDARPRRAGRNRTLADAIVAVLCVACADRTTGPGATQSDDASPSSSDDGTAASAESAQAEAAGSADSGAPAPFLDCRPVYYDPYQLSPECTQTYGATVAESFSSYACANCVCVEFCEHDDDCIDRGAPVLPRCLPLSNPSLRSCFLVCETDEDCPNEMVCLPSNHLSEKACYLPWRKPECCEHGWPTCP